MTCKEMCVHSDVCPNANYDEYGSEEILACDCPHFKPKSRFVELPCEVGQTVYVVSPVLFVNISFEDFLEKKRKHEDIKVYEQKATLPKIAEWITPTVIGTIAWGKTVFLSREEAVKALAERSK